MVFLSLVFGRKMFADIFGGNYLESSRTMTRYMVYTGSWLMVNIATIQTYTVKGAGAYLLMHQISGDSVRQAAIWIIYM